MKVPHADITTPTAEIRGDGEFIVPKVEVTKPKIKGDVSGKAASVQMPSVDISLPKVKGKSGTSYSVQGVEGAGKSEINMPAINISAPDAGLDFDSGQRIPDEVEGTVKGPKISLPKVDVSLPKMEAPGVNIKGPGGGGKFNPPSVDVSFPKMKSDSADVDMDYYVGGDGKFRLPDFDVTLPKMNSPDGEGDVEVGFKLPKVDLALPKSNAGEADREGKGKFQLPSVDVSLPNLKAGKVEVGTEGQKVKGGKFEMPGISLPKGEIKGDIKLPKMATAGAEVDVETSADVSVPKPRGEIEGKVEGGKFSMPSVNISLPKMKLPEGNVKLEAPDLPQIDLSLPTSREPGSVDLEGKGGAKFNMPTFDISLPKGKTEDRELDVKEPAIKGGAKFNMPSLDISLPTIKPPEGGTDIPMEGPEFHIKSPTANVSLKGTGIKEEKMNLPAKDISLPKEK
uniref:AHNK n=1 Tax=Poeciliopsis prolifica TaxID=188132 RepID=A0A0S7EXQ3_9TELE